MPVDSHIAMCAPRVALLLVSVGLVAGGQWQLSPLRRRFQDAASVQLLQEVWGAGRYPLATALDSAPSMHRVFENVSATCLQDVAQVLSGNHSWTVSMVDASVKVPEGLLAGEFTQLGNWDECVAVRDQASSDSSLQLHGQMCLVGLLPGSNATDGPPSPARDDDGQEYSMMTEIMLRLAVCVPSTCNAQDVQLLFTPLFQGFSQQAGWPLEVRVRDSDCTTRDKPPFDTADWVAVGVLSVLAALLVTCTVYDMVTPSRKKRAILTAFSVATNGKKMLAAPRAGVDQTLSCLHGIRFLSMCWVVLGHRHATQLSYPVINPGYIVSFTNDIWRIGITNATLSVDTFFVLSGLLVAYLFFRQPPASRRRLNIPLFYLHRYIRLTPALALMILLRASVISHMGWGPLWPSSMESAREDCQKSWWNILLYVNNYVNPEVTCIGQSWYLMVDMQLHWLSPFLILPLAWFPRTGIIIMGLLCGGGLIANFLISFLLKLPGQILAPVDTTTFNNFFNYFYVPTYARFIPYLEGFALGYYLACWKESKAPRKVLPLFLCLLSWLLVAALLLVPLFTGYFFFSQPFPSNTATAFYNCFNRAMWSLGVAGVVYLCATGNGKPVNTILSWVVFQILGRFSYCIYLVHMTIMGMEAASTRTNSFLSEGIILPAFASDILVSLFCAMALSLVCESPFLVLEKELLGRGKQRNVENTKSSNILPEPNIEKNV